MNVNDLVLVFNRYYHHTNHRIFFVFGSNHEIEEITHANRDQSFSLNHSLGTYIVSSKTDSNRIRLISLNYEELGILEFTLNELDDEIKHDWTNYLNRTIVYLRQAGYRIKNGMDILIYGNIPSEVGLSSSRSMEVLIAAILKSQNELD